MTIEWFSFLFGAMSLLCVEFFIILAVAVKSYKQKTRTNKNGS